MRHDPTIRPEAQRRSPFSADHPESDYDVLAKLFLGGESRHADTAGRNNSGAPAPDDQTPPPCVPSFEPVEIKPTTPAIRRKAKIEALILGHLPGMASPWASQYAATLADDLDEPVGLIHLSQQELSIELIAGVEWEPIPLPTALSLDKAIAHLISHAPLVLIRVDAVHEPQIVSSNLLDAITVLSGADEAAVVSSYRTMKGIAGHRAHTESTRFQAAIMGVNPHDAERAMTHLRRAVQTFLDDELTQTPGVQRVAPIRRATLCRDFFAGSVEDLLSLIHAAKHPSPSNSTVRTSAAPSGTGVSTVIHNPTAHVAKKTDETHIPQPALAANVSLAQRIPELCPLETRCPHCELIELAADSAGRLHLLMSDSDSTVGDLIAVKAWAEAHGAILRRAEPLLTESSRSVALHVSTDRPSAARRLLDTPVHVHLLARADSDGVVCMPLNDPD